MYSYARCYSLETFLYVGLPAGWNAASESGGSGHGPYDSTSSSVGNNTNPTLLVVSIDIKNTIIFPNNNGIPDHASADIKKEF